MNKRIMHGSIGQTAKQAATEAMYRQSSKEAKMKILFDLLHLSPDEIRRKGNEDTKVFKGTKEALEALKNRFSVIGSFVDVHNG